MNRQSLNQIYKVEPQTLSRQSTCDKILTHQRARKSPFRYEPPTVRKPLMTSNLEADHRDELIKHLTHTNQCTSSDPIEELMNKLTDTMQRQPSFTNQDSYEQDYKALMVQYNRLQDNCEQLNLALHERSTQSDKHLGLVSILEKQLSNVEFAKDEQLLNLQNQLEHTISSLHKENQDLWQKLQDSSSMYLQYEREVKQLNEVNITHISDENLQLMNSVQKLQDSFNARDQDCKRFEQQLNEVRAVHKDQQSAWEQSATGRTRDFLKRREEEWEETRLTLQNQLERLQKDREHLDLELTKKNNNLLQERLQSDQVIKQLRTQNSDQTAQVDKLLGEVEELKKTVESLNEQILQNNQGFGRERTYYEQLGKQQKTKIGELQAQEKQLNKQIQALTEELNDKIEQIACVEVQFTREKEQFSSLVQRLETKQNAMQINMHELEGVRETQANEIVALNAKIVALRQLESVIEQLKTQRLDQQLDYEAQIKELNVQHAKDLVEQAQDFESQLQSKEEDIKELDRQLEEGEKLVNQLRARIKELNEELDEHEEARLSANQDNERWRKKMEETHVPLAEHQSLQSQLANKTFEAKTFKERNESAEGELSRLRKEITGFEEELERRKQQLVEADELQIKRRRENDQVLLQNETLKREITKLQQTQQQLQNQMSDHTLAFSSTQQNFESDLKHSQQKVQLLEQELQSKNEQLRNKIRELEEVRAKSSEEQMKLVQSRSSSQRAGRDSIQRSSLLRP